MDDYQLRNLSDTELKHKINQLRVLIWAAVGVILALEVFLMRSEEAACCSLHWFFR